MLLLAGIATALYGYYFSEPSRNLLGTF